MHTTKYTIQQIMTTKHNRKQSCLKKVSYTTIYPLTTNIGLQFYLRCSVEPNKYPLFPKAWLIISQPSHHSLCCEILQNVLTIITYCKICNRTDHSNKTQQKTRNILTQIRTCNYQFSSQETTRCNQLHRLQRAAIREYFIPKLVTTT